MEFALVVPLFLFLVFGTGQLGVIALTQYSLDRSMRETARWLAVRWINTTDDAVQTHARSNRLSMVDPNSRLTVTVSPACSALSGSPAQCPTASSDPNRRLAGQPITVSGTYQINGSGLIFFPAGVHIGDLNLGIPTGDRHYTVTVMME